MDQASNVLDMPVTEEAVCWAYRLILGREPENTEVVTEQQRMNASVQSLRRAFLNSPEFTDSMPRGFLNSPEFMDSLPQGPRIALRGLEPRNRIDCDGAPAVLARLFEHVSRSWHELGDQDPFYSVATAPEYRGMPPSGVIRKFFESGVGDVQRFLNALERNGLDLHERPICLEFGCGLGRMTRALAPHFQKTIGVDISASHLAQAEKYASEAKIGGIEWKHLSSVSSLDELPQVDVIYSMIVLQHNPPPVINRIVATFTRILKPGGIAYFQVPTYRLGYDFDLQAYLDSVAGNPSMEMHVYPQDRVFRHFDEAGGVPVSVVEDDATGMNAYERSNTFLFLRKK